MTKALAVIGFGEAGKGFAMAARWGAGAAVFDIVTGDPELADAKRDDYRAAGVDGHETLATALADCPLVLCLVTADQALAAALAASAYLKPGTLWCDMNSVAPATKRAAAAAITAAGGRYLDVAIMAPVHPAHMAVPLLIAGPDADAGDATLAMLGFTNRRLVGAEIGAASAVKMLRSVIVKGQEALTAECLQGAARAGLVDEVLTALGGDWAACSDYNLDRMMVHGARRAAEMDEVAATLMALGVDPIMTRSTAQWQRAVGTGTAPPGLAAKLVALA